MKITSWLHIRRPRKPQAGQAEQPQAKAEQAEQQAEQPQAKAEPGPEKVSSKEFLARIAACIAANAAITALGEYANKVYPHWAVMPVGRCCTPMSYIALRAKWWNPLVTAEYGTANGAKVLARISRAQARLVSAMLTESQDAVSMALGNKWSVIDY